MMNYRKYSNFAPSIMDWMKQSFLTLLILFLAQGISFSQIEKVSEAINFYDKNDLDKARAAIDLAMLHAETSMDGRTWYYAGFIYDKIYKQRESSNPNSEMREKAIECLKKSISLNTDPKYSVGSTKLLKSLATSYYNDAVRTMTRDQYNISKTCHELYLKLSVFIDPAFDVKKQKIDYFNALGSLFTRIHDSEVSGDESYWHKARESFEQVISIEPNNLNANYNLGILFYNKAVNIINGADYDIDLVALSDIQDTSIVLLKQSLPYMETAYRLQPNNENTLVGLSGIYFGLYEIEKSEQIKKELEILRMGK